MARKVIFDTDPGVDDALALLLLSRLPEVDLVGITTVFGNADLATVTRNALYLKALYGIAAPVARGAGRALARPSGPAPAMVHGENGLGDARLDDRALPDLDPRPAHVLIADLVRQHPGEITIVAVGRLTNLALMLAHDPGIAPLVGNIVVMGGAFRAPGNVNPAAEANILGDPHAADIVLGADWPVAVVGLDVTRRIILDRARLDAWASRREPAMRFVAEAKDLYMRYHDRFGVEGCYIHDSAAVAYAVAPEHFTCATGRVRVVTDGLAAGQTILREAGVPFPPNPAWDEGPHQTVALGVDADAVLALMDARL